MELNDVRIGNYVKEFEYSSRAKVLLPFYRVAIDDLAYHDFMVPIPIDLEWCKRLGMDITERIHPSGNYDWIAESAGIKIRADKGRIIVFYNHGGSTMLMEHIKYVHQIQNFYYGFWGMEIDEIKNENSEFYNKSENE